jgi:outer membrane protein assembly factor BamB
VANVPARSRTQRLFNHIRTPDESNTMETTNHCQLWSSPAVSNGIVYIGSFDHSIHALNASTGSQLWKFQTCDEVYSSPTVVEGTVYIASDDGLVYALNAQTGKPFWNYATGGVVQSSAAVSGGIVYIRPNDTNIYIKRYYGQKIVELHNRQLCSIVSRCLQRNSLRGLLR